MGLLKGVTFLNTNHSNTDDDLCYEVFRCIADDDQALRRPLACEAASIMQRTLTYYNSITRN